MIIHKCYIYFIFLYHLHVHNIMQQLCNCSLFLWMWSHMIYFKVFYDHRPSKERCLVLLYHIPWDLLILNATKAILVLSLRFKNNLKVFWHKYCYRPLYMILIPCLREHNLCSCRIVVSWVWLISLSNKVLLCIDRAIEEVRPSDAASMYMDAIRLLEDDGRELMAFDVYRAACNAYLKLQKYLQFFFFFFKSLMQTKGIGTKKN